MKILFLSPGLRTDESVQNRLNGYKWAKKLLGSDVELVGRGLEKGSVNSEGYFDDYIAGAEVFKAVMNVKEEGFNGVVIADTGDPFIDGLREFMDIPVVGPMETSLHVACTLGYKFSIITPAKFMVPRKVQQVERLGLKDRLASVRHVVESVDEVRTNPEKTVKAIIRESKKAIEEDGAQVIITMCGGMVNYLEQVQQELSVPVIEPIRAALKYAESLVRLGLTHSKISYPKPREKKRIF